MERSTERTHFTARKAREPEAADLLRFAIERSPVAIVGATHVVARIGRSHGALRHPGRGRARAARSRGTREVGRAIAHTLFIQSQTAIDPDTESGSFAIFLTLRLALDRG